MLVRMDGNLQRVGALQHIGADFFGAEPEGGGVRRGEGRAGCG